MGAREEEDRDGDGRFERETFFENGTKTVTRGDLDANGRTDLWIYYAGGREDRNETDTNGDEKADFWRYFEAGPKVVLNEKDLNFDGKIDERKMMVWTMDRNVGAEMFRPAWIEADRNFDGKIDEFWVKGSLRDRVKDKTGAPMKTTPKLGGRKKTASGSLSPAHEAVNQKEDFERLIRESRPEEAKESE